MAGAGISTAVRASGILRAVDDDGPFDQIFQIRRVETEALAGHRGDEGGAGFVARVVELAPAGIAAEMFGIGGAEEGALMVIEPPRQARIARILEIDDGVFVAIEQFGRERLGCRVSHSRVPELGVRMYRSGNEAAEEGSRGCPIKAMVVVQHAFQHGKNGKTYQLA